MKSFKDIRQTVNEEYYSGPTTYAADKTNVGDIAGSDFGSQTVVKKKPYATVNNMAEIIRGSI